jgi:hypothetical protein
VIIKDEPKINEDGREVIQRCLESAQSQVLKGVGRQRQEPERRAVQEALTDLESLRSAYHEALADQANSAMVKQITDDLAGLISMLRGFGTESPSGEQEAEVYNRIRSWHYESRRWIGDLPLQPCLTRPAVGEGGVARDRVAEARHLWLEAGGAWFIPPPHARREQLPGTPAHLNLWAPLPPVWDPLDPHTLSTGPGTPSRRVCRPALLIKLLALAQEALEAEIGGRNLGGHARFAQRRRTASLKDGFALTCLLIYEKAVGPKSAQQGEARRRDLNTHSFDHFVALVHRWVAGPDAPGEWEPGIEPIRKAIAIRQARRKLLKVAGCVDDDAFKALPLEAQRAAARKLPDKVRRRLTPAARPLI